MLIALCYQLYNMLLAGNAYVLNLDGKRSVVCVKHGLPQGAACGNCHTWVFCYHISLEMLNLFITLKGHKYACHVC